MSVFFREFDTTLLVWFAITATMVGGFAYMVRDALRAGRSFTTDYRLQDWDTDAQARNGWERESWEPR